MQKKGGFFKSSGPLIVSLAVINLLIVASSILYYRFELNNFVRERTSQLNTLAEAKTIQIIEWANERNADARFLFVAFNDESFFPLTFAEKKDKSTAVLQGMFLNGKYESILITDSVGNLLYGIPADFALSDPYLDHFRTNKPERIGEIQIGDVFMVNDSVHALQIMVPLQSERSQEIAGTILMNINLQKDFLPKLNSIPILKGVVDLYLVVNDNRGSMILNKPYDSSSNEIITAFSKGAGFRNHLSIFVSQPVPGSNTKVVIKMDGTRVWAELKPIRTRIFTFTLLFIAAFSAALSFFWANQKHEFALLRSEKHIIQERFDLLSKFSNDAIIVYTKDLIIIQVNDKALDLYGYSREEILGMSAELLRAPETRSQIATMIGTTISEGGYICETVHLMKDGTRFPVEVSIRYVELMGNECFQSVVRDITQRKRYEKAIIASEERLRLLTNTLPQIVWTANPDGAFDYVNSRFERLTGLQALKETSISGFIHPEDQDRLVALWRQALQAPGEQQIRLRLKLSDGSYRWFLCIAIPLCDENGRLLKWYGSATDIDELENQVSQRTAELSDLYNNAPCGYHSMDLKGYFTQINNTAISWLGYEREELIGVMSFADLITKESRKALLRGYKEILKTGHVDNHEFEMIRKDGSIMPVLLSASTVKDGNGNTCLYRCTMVDHTQRRKYENEILNLNEILQVHGYNLEFANKELEAFIFSVSHDLRAPLRAINGFGRILMDEHSGALSDEGRKLLNQVLTNADRMRQLIDDLLRLSRTGKHELNYTKIDMHALFTSMIEEIRQQFPHREIDLDLQSLPEMKADLSLIKQVISNLLSNAVKFSGKENISRIEVGTYSNDHDPAIYIKDNGTGFDMKYVKELFGVFKRLDNAADFEGTGVGLALAKRIIDRHGGKIWAESAPGKGATFYFTIPQNE